ncbi:MAG: polyprenyl synthetase family protein [Anaerolineae bacterium]|nr:polyprenyl synthetase family protein [Anaerolineae bacterium]
MTTSELINQLQQSIEIELQNTVDQFIPDKNNELYEMLCYHMGWIGEKAGPEAQGKRIRPVIILLASAALGCDWHKALPAAAGMELLHNFSLIHDDIQDASDLRRGRETVWRRWGIAQAINAGDCMFTMAHLSMLRLKDNIGFEKTIKAAGLLQQAAIDITNGQYLDLSFEKLKEVSLDAYINMINGKTASLIGCAAELGGVVAGGSTLEESMLKQFGISLGLAFQAQDDWLGIWGDSAMTGKSNESDIVSGKKSLPVLFGLQQNGTFRDRWMRGPIAADEVAVLSKMLIDNGAQEYTRKMSDKFTLEAVRALDRLGYNNEAVEALRELVSMLINRKK